MITADQIYKELCTLPEPIAREVLDFAKFLRQKSEHENLTHAQESSMQTLWANEDDDAWNDVPTR